MSTQKHNIKKVKLRKVKFRNTLRLLRKLDIYNSMFPKYSRSYFRSWLRKKKSVQVSVGKELIITKVIARGKFTPVTLVKSSNFSKWGSVINKLVTMLKKTITVCSYKYTTNVLFNKNYKSLGLVYIYGSMSRKRMMLFRKTNLLKSNINNLMVLNNKKAQLYITILSKQFWGWKTDASIYPGVMASLFGIEDKKHRRVYKKKDKNIMKILLVSAKVAFPRFLKPKTPIFFMLRRKPKSVEIYKFFMTLVIRVCKLKIRMVMVRPEVRHSFIKLRKYARLKRRLRKTITKRSEGMVNNSLIKEAECSLVTENYISRFLGLK